MTLGTYPDEVPATAVIPPAVFAPAATVPTFRNVAAGVGLAIYGLSGGVVLEDLDRDGLLDLMVSSIGFADPIRVFRNDGNGRYSNRTATSGLDGINGGLNLVHADYDNDGLADVLVLRGAWMESQGRFPVSLLRNIGNLRFVDVTEQAGLLTALRPRRPRPGSTTMATVGSTCSSVASRRRSRPTPASSIATIATARSPRSGALPASTWSVM